MTERKRPRRTRARILETSLELFNRFGEPHITTGDIAVEMSISPGNLYYHFRNKEEITSELYDAFEAEIRPLLANAGGRRLGVEDLWLWLHLWLERMLHYRFLFRDLVDLAARHHRIGSRVAQLLQSGEATLRSVLESMRSSGELRASEQELHVLARNAMLILTHCMAYERLIRGRSTSPDEPDLNRAAYYVLMLLAPHVLGDARTLVQRLSHEYLASATA